MAYFSNGTEGMCYMESYCFKCKNFRDKKDGRGFGCPIWDLHLFYSYELCNSKTTAKKMLDFLIPKNKKTCCADECSMFLSKTKEDIEKEEREFKRKDKEIHKDIEVAQTNMRFNL